MKHIIYTLALLAGSVAFSAEAATIRDAADFRNDAIYNINRVGTASVGGGYLHATEGTNIISAATSAKVDRSSAEARWSIHYSKTEKAYYLYNLGTGKFLYGNSKNKAVLTDDLVDCVPMYNEELKYWMLDCGGYFIGMPEEYEGKAVFADDLDRDFIRTELNAFFTISSDDDETLTAEQIAAIEEKIKAGREAKLADYLDFLDDAKNVATNNRTENYLGAYDYEELEYALNNADNYSLAEIEEIYQKTILSRFPNQGCYYRLRNSMRPNNTYYRNVLSPTAETGEVMSRDLQTPAFGTAAEGYTDDLALVRFRTVNGDVTKVKIEFPAIQKYLTAANSGGKPGFTSSYDDAYTFQIETTAVKQRFYRFAQPDKDNWLTISGGNVLVGYGTRENAMRFYIEPVNTITVPVDANGYASVCVPCGVNLPEGVKAYTVTDFSGGKAYIEELEAPIHLNTPFIVKAPAGQESVDLIVENTTKWVATAMGGTMIMKNDAPGRYVPTFSANGISFTYTTEENALPGSAYIISEDLGEITTVMGANPDAGIEEITLDEAVQRELFDLQGRRVISNPLPGIYINATTKRPVRIN